jgi:hypothetical protein
MSLILPDPATSTRPCGYSLAADADPLERLTPVGWAEWIILEVTQAEIQLLQAAAVAGAWWNDGEYAYYGRDLVEGGRHGRLGQPSERFGQPLPTAVQSTLAFRTLWNSSFEKASAAMAWTTDDLIRCETRLDHQMVHRGWGVKAVSETWAGRAEDEGVTFSYILDQVNAAGGDLMVTELEWAHAKASEIPAAGILRRDGIGKAGAAFAVIGSRVHADMRSVEIEPGKVSGSRTLLRFHFTRMVPEPLAKWA